jgi:hypothetical protein
VAAKKKPSKTSTWMVTSSGQVLEVQAETVSITDGALMFMVGNKVTQAFADTGWTSMTIAEPEET